MGPQVRGQPGAAVGVHAPEGAVHGTRDAPEVRVVVRHPAVAVIHLPRSNRAGFRQVLDHPEEGDEGLVEAAHVGGPVVHLGVDVDRVLAVPRGHHLVVPDALEVRRLAAGLGGADQQVAAVIEDQGHHAHVIAVLEGRLALVRRQGRIRAGVQLDGAAAVLLAVGGLVPREELLVGELRGGGQARLRGGGLVAGNVVIIDVIRRGVHQQGHVRRAGNGQLLVLGGHFSVTDDLRAALGREPPGNALVLHTLDARHERLPLCRNLEGELAILREGEGQCALLAGVQPDDEGAVAQRGERAPRVADAVRREADPRDGAGQVQVAAVVLDLLRHVLEMHPEAAQREEPLAVRAGNELFVDQRLRFLLASRVDELADLVEVLERRLAVVVVRGTAPEGGFVQLDGLVGDAAEHHRGHLAVAEGQGFEPPAGRGVIPQAFLVSGDLGRLRAGHHRDRDGKKGKEFLHNGSVVCLRIQM